MNMEISGFYSSASGKVPYRRAPQNQRAQQESATQNQSLEQKAVQSYMADLAKNPVRAPLSFGGMLPPNTMPTTIGKKFNASDLDMLGAYMGFKVNRSEFLPQDQIKPVTPVKRVEKIPFQNQEETLDQDQQSYTGTSPEQNPQNAYKPNNPAPVAVPSVKTPDVPASNYSFHPMGNPDTIFKV